MPLVFVPRPDGLEAAFWLSSEEIVEKDGW